GVVPAGRIALAYPAATRAAERIALGTPAGRAAVRPVDPGDRQPRLPWLRRSTAGLRLGPADFHRQGLPQMAVAGVRARLRHDRDRPLREQDQPMAAQHRLTAKLARAETTAPIPLRSISLLRV